MPRLKVWADNGAVAGCAYLSSNSLKLPEQNSAYRGRFHHCRRLAAAPLWALSRGLLGSAQVSEQKRDWPRPELQTNVQRWTSKMATLLSCGDGEQVHSQREALYWGPGLGFRPQCAMWLWESQQPRWLSAGPQQHVGNGARGCGPAGGEEEGLV